VNFCVFVVNLRCLHPVQQNLLGKFQQWHTSWTRSVAVRATSLNTSILCVLIFPNTRSILEIVTSVNQAPGSFRLLRRGMVM
jgi:hypothetical protein